MALIPGTRLGVYEVSTQIGVGGMGEVYRARDTKLERIVALKVLPDAFVSHPERVARFQREAKTLAALNHPNIGGIYGLEEYGGVTALVLELVEGPTLADRIADTPISVNEALRLARQIAEALEAAHEQGIVHRDLKPANIKVRPDGTVKVLDFGLAKAMDPGLENATASGSLQVTSPAMTAAGIILGTAAYMSPEQARGLNVDKRTDIWAFGCVLYEMLTGRALFAGTTISDTIAAILHHAPDWSALPAATPPAIKRLLARCLDKDLRRRLQHIGEARIEIEDAINGASPDLTATAVADDPRSSLRLLRWIAAISSAVALVAVGVLVWHDWTAPPGQSAPLRVSRMTMVSSREKTVALTLRSLAITPDGERVVYIGNKQTQLFVRPLDQLDATPILTGTAPLSWPFVSPDGKWIGFVDGNNLKKMAITGGPQITIAAPAASATWLPDNTIVMSSPNSTTGLQRVSADGGTVTTLTRPDTERGEAAHLWPEMLPGGRAVLFTITAITGGLDSAQVAVFDLATKATTVVVRGGSHAQYVPSGRGSANAAEREFGHLVFVARGTLRAVPFDLARLETSGAPVAVIPRLLTTPQGSGSYAVAFDGTLAYVDAPEKGEAGGTLVWVDRQGREDPLPAPSRPYFQPRVSPDGRRVAVAIADQDDDIWVLDGTSNTPGRRTFAPEVDFFPVWMPDGQHLIFASQRGTGSALYRQRTEGTASPEPLGTSFPSGALPSGVTPDGVRVLFHTNIGNRDLMTLALDTAHVQPLVATPFNERNAVVSRDGRWLAYESDSSGRYEIYVRPLPDTNAGESQISTAGGMRPVWAPNEKELFYEAPDGAIMAVPVEPRGAVWSAGSPVKVVDGKYLTQGGGNRNYDVSADGKRFLMVREPVGGPAAEIVVVQNWFEELKRLAPAK